MQRLPACPRLVETQSARAETMRRMRHILLWSLVLLPVLFSVERRVGYATCRTIADLASQGAYGVADASGRIVDSCNSDRALVPASVLKIATVSAALTILGPEYRFLTEFYLDGHDNLYVKGFGDPTLFSEEVSGIVEQLQRKGLRRVQTLYVDTSTFALTMQVPGQEDSDNAYDAPIGPLSVNFNSAPINKDVNGRIVSGESLTPTLPIMQELGRERPAGRYRVNICAQGCNAESRMAQYAGELFRALLQQGGVPVESSWRDPLGTHTRSIALVRASQLPDVDRYQPLYPPLFFEFHGQSGFFDLRRPTVWLSGHLEEGRAGGAPGIGAATGQHHRRCHRSSGGSRAITGQPGHRPGDARFADSLSAASRTPEKRNAVWPSKPAPSPASITWPVICPTARLLLSFSISRSISGQPCLIDSSGSSFPELPRPVSKLSVSNPT